jgi:murein DD-endopeptidase MepM/ murein hydrolase activator NlpD
MRVQSRQSRIHSTWLVRHILPYVFSLLVAATVTTLFMSHPYTRVVGRSLAKPLPETSSYPAYPNGSFAWPTNGAMSQPYWLGHRGLDIAGAAGTPVVAADAGVVIFAGWSTTGYGYAVEIDHGNGFSTLYAHLSAWHVSPGRAVARGQIIGAMGSTGNSTGPHTHFEVRYRGQRLDPLAYLSNDA